MATGLIQQLQIDNGDLHNIAPTVYGICHTPANEANKTVSINGFELINGTTIYVKFDENNTAINPTLNVSNTGASAILLIDGLNAGTNDETNGWFSGAIISFTFDGTNWIRNSGYNTNTTYTTLTAAQAEAGLDTTGQLISAKILKDAVETLLVTSGDTKVSQIGTTENNELSILLKNTNNLQDEITTVKYGQIANKLVTVNPSSGILTAIGFSGSGADLTNIPYSALSIPDNSINISKLTANSITIAGNSVQLGESISLNDLGLANAMHFIGIVDNNSNYKPSDDTSGIPTIHNFAGEYTPTAGDVVIDPTESREYVYTISNTWELLGQDASTTIDSDLFYYSSDATDENTISSNNPSTPISSNNIWISRIQQLSDRTLILHKTALDTSGEWSGNAVTATTLETARTILIALESTTAASFDGSINITPGVSGILPISNGGTNSDINSLTVGGVIYVSGPSGSEAYASTIAGEDGQVLISNGSSPPTWYTGLTLTSTTANNSTTYDATFDGTVSIASDTTIRGTLEVTGATTLLDDLTITGNIIPSSTNTYTLGTSGNNGNKWSNVYIGTQDSYGTPYQPVYWNEGVPAIVNPVQYQTWVIGAGAHSVTYTHEAYNADTYVLSLVITSGEDHLPEPLVWTTADGIQGNGTLTIAVGSSNSAATAEIRGYVITANGIDITPHNS